MRDGMPVDVEVELRRASGAAPDRGITGPPASLGRVETPADDAILLGDNLDVLPGFADETFQLAYLDPPFNTGKLADAADASRRAPDENGDRNGFGGRRYATRLLAESSYRDSFDDYLGFLEPRLREVRRVLDPTGTLYFHIDYREAHYCKLLLDELFGRDSFLNEIVWAYDYGARTKRRWPAKHDTILVYVKDPARVLLRRRGGRPRAVHGARARRAGEGGARKAARPTCGGTRSSRRPGGRRPATRRRSPRACCAGWCRRPRDPATGASIRSPGSGTLGAVARDLERRYVLVDSNPDAVEVARKRLAGVRTSV